MVIQALSIPTALRCACTIWYLSLSFEKYKPQFAGINVAILLQRTSLTSEPKWPPAPDTLIRSEEPEVAESLFNRRDLVWWAGILLGSVPWYGEAKLLFAARNPGALGHKAVLAHNPFLDFLVCGAWTKRLLLARLTRAPVSSFLVSATHAGFGLPAFEATPSF